MSKAEKGEATREALMAAARKLFAEKGYSSVGTEDVVRSAAVTRGALYHHFKDKKDLFRAVYEQVEKEVTASLSARMQEVDGDSDFLEVGIVAYLKTCSDPDLANIALIDAPAVLGRSEWLEIGSRYGFGLVTASLQHAVETGLIRRQPVEPLARLVFAAMVEAGCEVAAAPGDRARRDEIEAALLGLIGGLRTRVGEGT